MREEIRRIHEEAGITSVYVTHDQADALVMADQLAVMRAGRIEQIGTPQEIYEQPRNAFVARFIGETNLLPGTLRRKGQATWEVETEIGLLRAVPRPFGWNEGQAVFCSIRPERVHLYRQEPPTTLPNRFPARVLHSTYLGQVEEYRLLLNERLAIKALRSHTHEPPFRRQENLWVGLSLEDVVVVENDGEDVLPPAPR
jgi:spermidine/putrescine transport system ATP-binding protein